MDTIVSLIIPFIALAIISVMIDKLTLFLEGVMHKIPFLPDRFEWWFAYAVVLSFAFLVCWQGNFDLFIYLNVDFTHDWEGWLMTALVISGGSAFVRTQFSIIDAIPMALGGVTTTIKRMVSSGSSNTQNTQNTSQYQNSPYTGGMPVYSPGPSMGPNSDLDDSRSTDTSSSNTPSVPTNSDEPQG